MHTRLNDRELARRLAALPGWVAPAGSWQRAQERQAARGAPRRPGWSLALAASLLAAAGLAWLLSQGDEAGGLPAGGQAARSLALVPDALLEENARLERLLAALPERSAMRGSTAYTVAELEDQLAWVDDRLSAAALVPSAPEPNERLWRQRIQLMDSLVKVRYADAAGPTL